MPFHIFYKQPYIIDFGKFLCCRL